MPTAEFDLIRRCFTRPPVHGAGEVSVVSLVSLGIGDDCAVLQPTPGQQWCVSTDTLVAGVHFFEDVDAARLGHKALAVNLSDLAACGATPRAFFLALSLPRAMAAKEAWCQSLAHGLFALADAHGAVLAGGDTTRGPLSLTLTVMGEVPQGQALLRSGARVGDEVWISGDLGGAYLGLQSRREPGRFALGPLFQAAIDRLECPQPRVALGQALRGIAHSAIDLSDGLVADLGHVARASGQADGPLHFELDFDRLPAHPALALLDDVQRQQAILAGGDDYELAFTAPVGAHAAVLAAAQASGTPVHCVGRVRPAQPAEAAVIVVADGQALAPPTGGFVHF
ncbi:thiamine-phosphate kinase [Amphibiibacter pelophylacis]|uniref:Thiamine-phosphate kinase n=1 Tax=Amphibiibacter pelophylacis TaxID=1799477 RepID=A0ACC6P0X4_9BURK